MASTLTPKLSKSNRSTARMTTGGKAPRSLATIINEHRASRAKDLGRSSVRTRSEHRQFEVDRLRLEEMGYVYDEASDSFVRELTPPASTVKEGHEAHPND